MEADRVWEKLGAPQMKQGGSSSTVPEAIHGRAVRSYNFALREDAQDGYLQYQRRSLQAAPFSIVCLDPKVQGTQAQTCGSACRRRRSQRPIWYELVHLHQAHQTF